MLAKAVATECHCTFFNITASSLVSKWRGDSENYIRVLFELAYSHSPAIIFIDEIDWIATNKGDCILSEPAKRFRSEVLSRLDGLVSNENSNVVLLATTNSTCRMRIECLIVQILPFVAQRHPQQRAFVRCTSAVSTCMLFQKDAGRSVRIWMEHSRWARREATRSFCATCDATQTPTQVTLITA
uniref:katanin p60 ATPase-containing subunit A1-like n=1 Tax=Bombus vancouverensis nearcticus TaxID=2705178 RepID=UPI0014397E14|nr:katanin p60 ATPase-containing subunit A1-like [Bombus vancouverensis nearcticus]